MPSCPARPACRLPPAWVLPPSPFGGWLGPQGALATAATVVAEPARTITAPFAALFALGRGAPWFLHAALASLWAALVWGPIGGAIAPCAGAAAGHEGHV